MMTMNKSSDGSGLGPSLQDFMPDITNGYIAKAGEPLVNQECYDETHGIISVLETIYDPEIPVNIYELGLIYSIKHESNGDVKITMSLTAPGCPVAGEMPGQVAEAVAELDYVGCVEVELVWTPAWTVDRMSEDAKLALGI